MSLFAFVVLFLATETVMLLQAQDTPSRDPCVRFKCRNGGTCDSPLDIPVCHCPSGYGGDLCETEVEVKPGSCVPPTSPETGACTRLCKGDYYCPGNQKCCNTFCGTACTDNIVFYSCAGFCLNGGTCNTPADAPSCECPAGYSGERCEIYTRDNSGSCPVIKPGSIGVCGGVFCTADRECLPDQKCCPSACGGNLCTKGFENKNNPCGGFCLNGGKCNAPADAPSCECPAGYSGERCEIYRRDNSGSCPVIKPGDVGVCGGVFCTADRECQPGQKCCRSPCGGNLCTNVVEPTPSPLTCANVRCTANTICRHVAECPTCPFRPRCIPIGQVDEDIDTECRRQSYAEAILIENPKNSSSYNQLNCSRSCNKCPSGSDCVGGQANSGVCCRGQIDPKPGVCPENILICGGVLCENDYYCPGDQKCCPGCGSQLCSNPAEPPPPPITCALVLCTTNTTCRHVAACPTCPFEPRCLPGQVDEDIDTECRRQSYADAILIEDPINSSSYNQLNCSRPGNICPSGSDCVGEQARGVCCREQIGPKPGVCPENILICGGVLCENDYYCPGDQKCCPACGSQLCSNPVNTSTEELCGNTQCAPGEVCVQKQRYCSPEQLCIQAALVPTCVPLGCAKCEYNEQCRQTSTGYECYIPDECGGCPKGQVCRQAPGRCPKKSCPRRYRCYPTKGQD